MIHVFSLVIFEIFTVKLPAAADCTEFAAYEFDIYFGLVGVLIVHFS